MSGIDPLNDAMKIMTPQEVADYLRTNESTVRDLIARGELPSFDVAGEPRVQAGALIVWFQEQLRLKDLEHMRRALEDPKAWADSLRDQPALRRQILDASSYEKGTIGAFLSDAARAAEHPNPSLQRQAQAPLKSPDSSTEKGTPSLTGRQVMLIVNRYIGVSGGYLGDFSYRTHCEFYPEYCDLDYDPNRHAGTTRERFISILKAAPPKHQARILRGVVERFKVGEGPPTRTPELKEQLIQWAIQLEFTAPSHRFAVALSFPGERRDYVKQVDGFLCEELPADTIFYDERFTHELARINLDTYLQDIYRAQSRLIVVFICEEYAAKQWCGLEWRAIRDIVKARQEQDIMPFRFDDAIVSGLLSIDGYVDARKFPPQQAATLIVRRIQSMQKEQI